MIADAIVRLIFLSWRIRAKLSWNERSVFLKKQFTNKKNGKMFKESDYFNCDDIWDTYIISDTHFLHYRERDGVLLDDTIRRYCNRPEGWQDTIIKKWNCVVGENDKVLHLGDLTFGNKQKAMDITRRLNGDKYLIKGNHDRHSKGWFDDIGFTLIKNPFMVKCDIYGYHLLFSHKPQMDIPPGTINIHGHWHNKLHFIRKGADNTVHINVSVEKINYKPIKLINLVWRAMEMEGSQIVI